MNNLSYFEEQYGTAAATRDSLLIKTAVTGTAALLFLALTLFSLPTLVTGIFSLAFCIVIYAVCHKEINEGALSLLRLAPSNNCLQAVAFLATLIDSVRMLFAAEGRFFGAALFFSLCCSMLMKLLYVREILRNLELVRDNKTCLVHVSELILTKRYINRVCTVNPVVEFPNILKATEENDPTLAKNRKFVPLILGAALALSIVCAIVGDGVSFLSAWAVLSVVCASFTEQIAFILPYVIMQRKLRRLGSAMLGYRSVEMLRDVDTLLIRDRELFPPQGNRLVTLRFLSAPYMTRALEYTAVLLQVSHSPLEEAFSGLLDCPEERLPKVDQWHFIKNYGIVATVNGESVLLGNRNLLITHNILPCSQAREIVLAPPGTNLIYLAVNGVAAAALVFRYEEDRELKQEAERVSEGFTILTDTADCNINESMIQRRYDFHTKVIIPDQNELTLMEKLRDKQNSQPRPPVMITTQNALGLLESVRWAKRLYRTVDWSILTQKGSVLLGLVLTATALCLSPAAVSWVWVFLFHLIWSIPILALAFRRNSKN